MKTKLSFLKTRLQILRLTKILSKKPKKAKKNRVKTHRTKTIELHYGEVVPAEQANRKFPKFRNKNAHRAKIFGIKTSSIPEDQLRIQTKKEELVDEINDLRDLMEQMDERIESRSALMEDNYDTILKPKHAFEEKRLAELKVKHPTFRLSQLKQVLKKEWQKSPENPLNARILALSK